MQIPSFIELNEDENENIYEPVSKTNISSICFIDFNMFYMFTKIDNYKEIHLNGNLS